jgi:hypothetical protein
MEREELIRKVQAGWKPVEVPPCTQEARQRRDADGRPLALPVLFKPHKPAMTSYDPFAAEWR